ncbi:MAG: TVP38/TMEM64 family protein, partial [Zetaproteobacteria bacterium]
MGAYALLGLALVPALPLTIRAGIAFGAVWGTLSAWTGATLSATLAFLVARHGARETVERWVVGHPRLARIDEVVARHGWRILAFTRVVPVFPFNVQNYAYGLTGIRFSTYV